MGSVLTAPELWRAKGEARLPDLAPVTGSLPGAEACEGSTPCNSCWPLNISAGMGACPGRAGTRALIAMM